MKFADILPFSFRSILISVLVVETAILGAFSFGGKVSDENLLAANSLFVLLIVFFAALFIRTRTSPTATTESSEEEEKVSLPDLMEEIFTEGHAISTVIHSAKERIKELEKKPSHENRSMNPAYTDSLSRANKIISLLESNFTKIKKLAMAGGSENLSEAKLLLTKKIALSFNASSLEAISDQAFSLREWGARLNALVTQTEQLLHTEVPKNGTSYRAGMMLN